MLFLLGCLPGMYCMCWGFSSGGKGKSQRHRVRRRVADETWLGDVSYGHLIDGGFSWLSWGEVCRN
jgi:hypothetical protein